MSNPIKNCCLKLLALALAVPLAVDRGVSTALAQELAIDEIVVTARKRSESLQEVPISITAFTERQIDQAGIERPEDFIALTPNVSMINTVSVGDTQVTIRGIVSTRDAESNFAYVVDGVLMTNPNAFNEELFDLQQLEVLKGPQGALYGRNAVSGAILVTTKKPSNDAEAKIKVGVGNNELRKVNAVFSGPLAKDKLYGRLSASYREGDGFFRNDFTGEKNVDFFKDKTLRGRLIWDANENLSFDFRAGYSDVSSGTINFNAVFGLPGFDAIPGVTGRGFYEDVNEHDLKYVFNVPPVNEQENKEFSVKMDYKLGWADLTAVAAYNDLDEFLISDGTSAAFGGYAATAACQGTLGIFDPAILPKPTDFAFGAFGILPPYSPSTCDGYQYQERSQKDSSLEVRLTSPQDRPLRWIGGAYVADIEREVLVAYGADLGQGFLLQPYVPPTGPNPTDLLFWDVFDTKAYALFGQFEFDITEKMELAFALRYDREERKVRNQVPNVTSAVIDAIPVPDGVPDRGPINPAFLLNPAGIPDRSRDFDQLQPKISWSWRVQDDASLYASYGVGFRSGGFNSIGSQATVDGVYNALIYNNPALNTFGLPPLQVRDEFEKEVSKSFEVGVKSEWFSNRLRLNAAVFYTEVDDNQFFEFYPGPFGLLRVVTNIDEAEIKGFELDFTAAVSEYITLFGGYGRTDSEIKRNSNRPTTVGNELPYSPEFTLNLGAQFQAPVSDNVNLVARLDWNKTGETWFHSVQDDQLATLFSLGFGALGNANLDRSRRDAFDVLNARISLDSDKWTLTLWGLNITDEVYLGEVIPAPEFGGVFVHDAPRRSYGLDFTFRF